MPRSTAPRMTSSARLQRGADVGDGAALVARLGLERHVRERDALRLGGVDRGLDRGEHA